MNTEIKNKWIEINDLIEDLWGTPTKDSVIQYKLDLLMQSRNDMQGLINRQEIKIKNSKIY